MRTTVLNFSILAALAMPAAAQEAPAFPKGDVPASTGYGGYRYFQVATQTDPLAMRSQTSASSEVIGRLAPGTMVVNLGCTAGAARAWCDVQPVGGGPRGYAAAEFLKPGRSPQGGYAKGEDDSALRAGEEKFDATGTLPCTIGGGPTRQCPFGVARSGGGDGTVVVTRPDGRTRAIFFSLGKAIGADTSEADPGDFAASRLGETTTVTVGSERYAVPDAIVLGG